MKNFHKILENATEKTQKRQKTSLLRKEITVFCTNSLKGSDKAKKMCYNGFIIEEKGVLLCRR